MLQRLRQQYAVARSSIEQLGQYPNEAAVLVPVTDHGEQPEIILTKRAEHLTVHSGEVSFPGGKWEESDESLVVTALREAEEEIALKPEQVQIINVGPPTISRGGMKVTPYVGIVPHQAALIPNFDELDAIFRVPLSFFLEDRRVRTDLYSVEKRDYWSPVYHFEGYEIWGLTARVIVQFLNQALAANITREHTAPEFERTRARNK